LFYSFSIGATLKCNEYDRIEAKGYGNTRKSADDDADIEIAKKISSAVKAVSKDSSYVGTEGGAIQRDIGITTQVSEVETILKNKQDVHPLREPYKDGDIWVSERYICRSDAAKPYLLTLRKLSNELKYSKSKITPESCKDMDGIYNKITEIENILKSLNQMDAALKREYESEYAKIKEDCGKANKGIFIESNNKELKSKVSSYLTKEYGCLLSESAESAAMILKMDYEECEKQDMPYGQFSCRVCVDVNLQDRKTGKGIYEGSETNRAVWTHNMGRACAEAIKPIPNKIWEKFKDKINIGDCK
jgi:hypothetical protein